MDDKAPRPEGPRPGEFVHVAQVTDVPPGTLLAVDMGDDVVILVNVGGTLHALSAWCPHQGTALALGHVQGSALVCWAHLWSFDVATGTPIWPPMAKVARGYNLRSYPVRVEGSRVLIAPVPERRTT